MALIGDVERSGDGILGEGVGQANLKSTRGGNFFGGEEHLQCASFADEAWQALRASPSSDEAESSATMSEERVRAGDAAITGEREIESAPHAVAVDGGNGRSGEAGDGAHQALSHVREAKSFRAGERGDLVEIGSGGEEVRVAGEDEMRRRMRGEIFDGDGQRLDAGARETVGAVVGYEADDERFIVRFEGEIWSGVHAIMGRIGQGGRLCRRSTQVSVQMKDANLGHRPFYVLDENPHSNC